MSLNLLITLTLSFLLIALGCSGAGSLLYAVESSLVKDKFQTAWLLAHKQAYVKGSQQKLDLKQHQLQGSTLPHFSSSRVSLVFGKHVPYPGQDLIIYPRPSPVRGYFKINPNASFYGPSKCVIFYYDQIRLGTLEILRGEETCQPKKRDFLW